MADELSRTLRDDDILTQRATETRARVLNADADDQDADADDSAADADADDPS